MCYNPEFKADILLSTAIPETIPVIGVYSYVGKVTGDRYEYYCILEPGTENGTMNLAGYKFISTMIPVCQTVDWMFGERKYISRLEDMKIEHVAMYVNDLKKAKVFFEKYFGAVSNDGYHNEKTGFCSFFLTFDDGARLEIMNKPGMTDVEKGMARTGLIHIAFSVGSREKVDELTASLKKDGYEIVSGPRTTGDGYYESCIIGIEGNQIEITV